MAQLRFDGRVIAIPGAAQGMGRDYARLLAQRGAKLAINDIKGADETMAAVHACGGEAIENCGDMADPAETDVLIERAFSRCGRLDAVSDLLVRRGLPDYSVMELREWTLSNRRPSGQLGEP